MKPIYEYLDYRLYLKDFFVAHKNERHLSHRAILAKMDIASSGLLSNIIAERTSMSIEQANRFASIIGLSENESVFLKKLIYYSKAKAASEKNDLLEQLLTARRPHFKTLSANELSLFKKWYFVVIRDMLNYYWFVDDYESLAARIMPPISTEEARDAIDRLEVMGLIRRNDAGCLVPADAVVSTGDEISSDLVTKLHRQMLDLAKNALDTQPQEKRDISALSLAISESKMDLVKTEIRKFRKKLLQIAKADSSADHIYFLTMQLFAATRTGPSSPGARK